jgi:hypothetical protein
VEVEAGKVRRSQVVILEATHHYFWAFVVVGEYVGRNSHRHWSYSHPLGYVSDGVMLLKGWCRGRERLNGDANRATTTYLQQVASHSPFDVAHLALELFRPPVFSRCIYRHQLSPYILVYAFKRVGWCSR